MSNSRVLPKEESCLCVYHENLTLIVRALSNHLAIKDFLECLVCEEQSENCMLEDKTCPNCPGPENLKHEVENLLELEPAEEIEFQSWERVENFVQLVTKKLSKNDFAQLFVDMFVSFLPHCYGARVQSQYFDHYT